MLGLEDLAVGVSAGQSREITDRADRVIRFGSAALAPVMKYVPRVVAPAASRAAAAAAAATTAVAAAVAAVQPASGAVKTTVRRALTPIEEAAIDAAVKAFIKAHPPPTGAVDASTKRIEGSLDAALMHHVYTTLGHGALDQSEKIHARACFRAQLGMK